MSEPTSPLALGQINIVVRDMPSRSIRAARPLSKTRSGGLRNAIVEDPDGNAVGIMSPIDESRRRPPPPPP